MENPMNAKIKTLKILSFITAGFIIIQIASCGFILYPERRGRGPQVGRIDPGVAILDAILLLPGILPGIIAFAVDFSTGAIYVSSAGDSVSLPDEEVVNHASTNIDVAALERILSKKTGKPIHIDPERITVLRVNDPEFIKQHFVKAEASGNPIFRKG